MTLVYQLDAGCKRLLHVAKDRWEKSLDSFFDILPEETTKGIKFACTDMWKAYLKVIKNRAPQSLNILDRFHIAKKMSEALDKVRADELESSRLTVTSQFSSTHAGASSNVKRISPANKQQLSDNWPSTIPTHSKPI